LVLSHLRHEAVVAQQILQLTLVHQTL